jgi:hypothetical protein
MWRRNEEEMQIRQLFSYKKRMYAIAQKCRMYLADVYPWSQCPRRALTTISIFEIPEASAYKSIYYNCLIFLRKRFFRDSVIEGYLYVPEYIREEEDGTPSVWQRNYSYIYEYWVFNRLVKAFDKAGFQGLKDRYCALIRKKVINLCLGASHNEPIHAESKKGELQIDIFHGISAYRYGLAMSDPFPEFSCSAEGNNDLLTPDFAIVFTAPSRVEYFHWIVLDAKSGQTLRQGDIDKRNKYLTELRRFESEPPDQSWLIYSGNFSLKSGIEFNADSGNQLARNNPMTWDCNAGILNWKTQKLHPVGHIRSNILSLQQGGDPFQEFAQGIVSTARARLGLGL